LNFDSLPSAQGWSYVSWYRTGPNGDYLPDLPETQVFSVSGGVLHQNSFGARLSYQGTDSYQYTGGIDETLPFTLTVRARVLAEQGNYGNYYGFAFIVDFAGEAFGVGLGTNYIEDENNQLISFDNTSFHDYTLKGSPDHQYVLSIDGVQVATGRSRAAGAGPWTLVLGDSTGGKNAQADIASYTFTQVRPDLAVTQPVWSADQGVNFSYTISGADLPQPTTVGLYWSTDTTFDPSGPNQDTLAYSTTTQTAQSQTPYSVHVDPSQITAAPSGAKYLLAVIDPDDSVAESDDPNDTNNIAAVAYDPITADSVTSPDPQDISFTYDVKEAAPAQEFDVAVYRSSSLSFSFDTAILVGQDFPIPALDMAGQSSVSLGQHTVMLNDPVALHPDPAHEYVFVVADPAHDYGDPDNTIHETHFRKFVLGAVVHGFQLQGGLTGLPSWEIQTSAVLGQLGYDQVIPFDWTSTSNLPVPGVTQAQGLVLALEIHAAADLLVLTGGSSGDVVDLRLIGHSRGAVVISQALLDLADTTDPVLVGGFKVMTMLDPHPANNSFATRDYSAANNVFGKFAVSVYQKFQALAQDPQVVIPSNVDEAELYYQHTPASRFSGVFNSEAYLNLWGEDPSLITNESSTDVLQGRVHDLTPKAGRSGDPAIGHSEVPLYFLFVLPQEKNKTYGGSGGLL